MAKRGRPRVNSTKIIISLRDIIVNKLKIRGKQAYPEKSLQDVIRDAVVLYLQSSDTNTDNLLHNLTTEIITGVACKNENGEILALPKPNRHNHIFALAAFCGMKFQPCLQGFMTDTGRFVTREEACYIVINNNQKIMREKRDVLEKSGQLFSEDVW